MKNRNVFEKMGAFMLGKGFYIVLLLCVATIGVSGYYLIRNLTPQTAVVEPVGGNTTVVLPDSEADGPDPVGSILPDVAPTKPVAAPTVPTQPDDPQPVKQPEPPRTPAVYTWPVKGELLRDFSVETLSPDPTLGDWRTHGGMDIAAPIGVEVLAMSAGTVSEVYEDGLMGTTIVLDHGEGLFTSYSNLAAGTAVAPGDTVETGTVIGAVGNSAIAEGGLVSHLHLEAWQNDAPIDPTQYLPKP